MTIDTRDKTHDFKFRELADHMLTHNGTGDLDGDFAHAFITLMGALGLVDVGRTGIVAMTRGGEAL